MSEKKKKTRHEFIKKKASWVHADTRVHALAEIMAAIIKAREKTIHILGGQGANTAAAALPPHAARLPSRSGGSGVGRKKNTVVSFVSPGPSSCVRGN